MPFIFKELSSVCFDDKNKTELLRLCHAWNYDSYDRLVSYLFAPQSSYRFFYCTEEGKTDWLAALIIFGSSFVSEICFIYTFEQARQKGLAKGLFLHLFDDLKNRYLEHEIFLEVRSSNLAAIKLYVSIGMEEVAKRKNYYPDGEDGLVFRYSRDVKVS